jgi:hypothetical protein
MKRYLIAATAALATLAPGAPARADEKADALLRQVAATTRATRTLQADLEITAQMPGANPSPVRSTGTVRLMKPNYARVVLKDGPYAQTLAATGTTLFTLQQNQYRKFQAKADGADIALLWAVPIRYFFTQNLNPIDRAALPAGATTRYVGAQTDSGKRVEVVEVRVEKPTAYTLTMYIGPDKRLVRSVMALKQGDETATLGARLANVKLDQPMTAVAFAYEPPQTAKAYEPPDFEAKLVAVGEKAPLFSLPTPSGGTLALADAVKNSRATLINFWFYG